MNDNYPRLCGGTFLTLLLREKRSKSKKQLLISGSDGLAQRFLFKKLILLVDPAFNEGYGTTFETDTSLYKACKKSNADYLPFLNDALIAAFDDKIKRNYPSVLKKMVDIVESFLNTESEPCMRRLVFSCLNLIKEDFSTEDAVFYAKEDGKPMNKNDLLASSEINLYSLLLGIWHFIIVNRKDNSIGFDTLSAWQKEPEIKGQRHTFESKIGTSYDHKIKISTTCEITDDAEQEHIKNIKEETEVEIINSVDLDTEKSKSESSQPIINNQFIFNQTGNGINIGQATNVVIKNGKVVDAE